jgi:hypothetical protein
MLSPLFKKLSAIALAALMMANAPTDASASKYREVDRHGAGNCVFSTGQLPKGNDNAPG